MRPIILWLLLMISLSSQASFFDLVKKEVTSLSKVNVADSLYQKLFRNNDSTTTLKALKELQAIANEADDVLLKCFVLSTFGDYYARIRDFGDLSTNYHLQAIELGKTEGSKISEAISNYKLGRYYYNFQRYPKAFEYLLGANYLEKEIGYSSSLQSGWIFYYYAKAYHEIGDFANAEFSASVGVFTNGIQRDDANKDSSM
ncbi:MAG: hypothetical protein H7178_11345 [Chitinophagaceae bacterium]|nr:hypothetical protein [Chitinophagaceae bacterium]